MVFGSPFKYGFALRTSPIVCGFDALYTTILFLFDPLYLKSPKAAALRVSKRRFRDVPDNEEGSLQKLQENALFRVFIFLFGTLPQVIKLCALQGLVWTKVWGLMFFASFLTLELLVLHLGRKWQANSSDTASNKYEDLEDYVGMFVICMSLLFSFYFFTLAIFEIVGQYLGELRGPYFLGCSVLGLVSIVTMAWSKHEDAATVAALIMVPISIFAGASTSLSLPAISAVSILPASIVYLIVVGTAVLFFLVTTVATASHLVQVRPEFAKNVDFGLGTYFFLLNLSAALLYYAFKYDPKGTAKPSWTDQLG